MSIKKQFSQYANKYDNYNIIQKIVAKSMIRSITNNPKRILELGCGTGQIYKLISWDTEYYRAVDFSPDMCALHPKNSTLKVECYDFDDDSFHNSIKNDSFDLVISSSSLQWSKRYEELIKILSSVSKRVNLSLFSSNTFRNIQSITKLSSPVLSLDEIKSVCKKYFDCEFEVFEYKLEFKSKKELFDYIKKSGVSGNANRLSYASAKELLLKYELNYLEFEVIFIEGISKKLSM